MLVTATNIGPKALYGRGLMNLQAATRLIGTPQLYSPSGKAYPLSDSQLSASKATITQIHDQLKDIKLIAVDSYDHAGFFFAGEVLIGNGNKPQGNIDALSYLQRSMQNQFSASKRVNHALTFTLKADGRPSLDNNTGYQLSYHLNENSTIKAGYRFC